MLIITKIYIYKNVYINKCIFIESVYDNGIVYVV